MGRNLLSIHILNGKVNLHTSYNSQELDIGASQKLHHLLKSSCQSDGHLGTFLVEQQIVKSSYSIEHHCLHRGPKQSDQSWNASRFKDG